MDILSRDLSVLSVKSRMDIMFVLKKDPHCVCDIEIHTGLSQSLISHHINDLQKSGFVRGTRDKKFIEYSLTQKGVQFLNTLESLLTKGGEKDNGRQKK
jgi:ArsR family transcriptional regulator, arsenate/arsenite/antimonite-responsive transcriptional repressor